MSTTQEQTTKTRSGRLVKKPERYVPVEKVEDDYATDEHDTEDEVDDDDYTSSEDEEESDSEGSLVDFVVPDESDSETESVKDE